MENVIDEDVIGMGFKETDFGSDCNIMGRSVNIPGS
jgi:hypothetical protein